MSLGYTTGFKVFVEGTEFGTVQGYDSIWNSESTTGVDKFFLQAHDSSGGLIANQFPMMSSGIVRKLIINIIVNGGGRSDNWFMNNGVDQTGIIANPSGLGVTEWILNEPFVLDDLINFRWRRSNSNGTLALHNFTEIEFDDPPNIQTWYSQFERVKGGSSAGFWCAKNGGQVNVGGNLESHFQYRAKQAGTIRDIVYYGISPVSADATPNFDVRINGVTQSTSVLSQHAGGAIDRFTGVDVPFVEGSLIGFRLKSASNTVNLEGRVGMRIEFD